MLFVHVCAFHIALGDFGVEAFVEQYNFILKIIVSPLL